MLPQYLNQGSPVNTAHPLNRGLLLWWLATPAAGVTGFGSRTWRDLTGRNHGTLTSAPAWRASTRPGGSGHLLANGSSDYVNGPVLTAMTSPSTIAISFNLTTTAGVQVVVGNYITGGPGSQIYVNGGTITYQVGGGTSGTTGGTVVADTWYDAVVTYDGSHTSGYLNGALVSGADTPSVQPTYTANFLVGRNGDGNFAGGRFDNAMAWNRCFSAAEVKALYAQSRLGNPDTLNWIRSPAMVTSAVVAGADTLMGQCWC